MNPLQELKISEWDARLSQQVRITVVSTNNPKSPDFVRFCQSFIRAAPKVQLRQQSDETQAYPSILVGENLRYFALPENAELDPFLEAIEASATGSVPVSDEVRNRINAIETAISVKVYITQHCPICPWKVRELIPVAILNPLIDLRIIDAGLFEEMAESDCIQSVPTVVFEDFRWTSKTPLQEMLAIFSTHDPFALSPDSIEEMLRSGEASKVAQMMIEREQILPSFPDFLADEKFSTRLGAMAAAEEIVKKNIKLAAHFAMPLWERFKRANDTVREDILYILGLSGNLEVIPMLESVSDGQYPMILRETAIEAIESIREVNSLE